MYVETLLAGSSSIVSIRMLYLETPDEFGTYGLFGYTPSSSVMSISNVKEISVGHSSIIHCTQCIHSLSQFFIPSISRISLHYAFCNFTRDQVSTHTVILNDQLLVSWTSLLKVHNRIKIIIWNSTTTFLWPSSSPVSNDLNVFSG